MALRDYQARAVNSAIDWMKKSVEPASLEMATGAGKSHVLAAIANWLYQNSGKRTLIIQPTAELLKQNHDKYVATGNKASIFSASQGRKSTRNRVIYATPKTVSNNLHRFKNGYGAVLIDECHGTTPTIQNIVLSMRDYNPNLRVIGCTATPYRTGEGYIYQYDINGDFVGNAVEPFFNTLLCSVKTRELIDKGYLTPAHADLDKAAHYDTSSLQVNGRGRFKQKEIEQVFEGHGRLTFDIVSDIVENCWNRAGVMIFAATVYHAKEIIASLPPDNARMIGGKINTSKDARQRLVADFKARKFKYLVNVSILTQGFDAPHVDAVAILRATESPGLLQQIIGRGLRLSEGKKDCIVLDYAGNISRHGLESDLFDPKIEAIKYSGEETEKIDAVCPTCRQNNKFKPRPNDSQLEWDKYGYFLDLNGNYIATENGPMPAHYGRRCTGQVKAGSGKMARCDYFWTSKKCEECGHHNDIAAHRCESCKAEIIDPNEKLKREFTLIKKDPYQVSTDWVRSFNVSTSVSRSGNEMLVCEYVTDYRKFKSYVTPSGHPAAVASWRNLSESVYGAGHVAPDCETFMKYFDKGATPQTVTYYKKRDSDFYRVTNHNEPIDEIPE